MDQILSNGLWRAYNQYKDIGLTEMSVFPAEGKCSVDYICDQQLENGYIYAIDLADYFIQSVWSGHTMIMYWCLDGFDYNKNCGFWDLRDKKYKLRPWYFMFKLISNYFHSYQSIQIIDIKQTKNAKILLIKKQNNIWSLLIISRKDGVIKFKLSDYIRTEKQNEIDILKYHFSNQYKQSNFTKISIAKLNVNQFQQYLLANSLIIITNEISPFIILCSVWLNFLAQQQQI